MHRPDYPQDSGDSRHDPPTSPDAPGNAGPDVTPEPVEVVIGVGSLIAGVLFLVVDRDQTTGRVTLVPVAGDVPFLCSTVDADQVELWGMAS